MEDPTCASSGMYVRHSRRGMNLCAWPSNSMTFSRGISCIDCILRKTHIQIRFNVQNKLTKLKLSAKFNSRQKVCVFGGSRGDVLPFGIFLRPMRSISSHLNPPQVYTYRYIIGAVQRAAARAFSIFQQYEIGKPHQKREGGLDREVSEI